MKVSTKTIFALYRSALLVLNPKFRFKQYHHAFCMMGALDKIIRRVRNINSNTEADAGYNASSLGISYATFSDFFFGNHGFTRIDAANKLRDYADSLIIERRQKTKMNVAALLKAARFIEDNPTKYIQASCNDCMFAIAVRLSGWTNGFSHGRELGLTYKQFRALYNYTHGRGGLQGYAWIGRKKPAQRAKLAAARLRRMALNGS